MKPVDWDTFASNIQQAIDLVETPVLPQFVAREQRVACGATSMYPPGDALFDAGSGEAYLFLDFGRRTVGRVDFEVQADGETLLQVFYGEDLLEAMREQDYSEAWCHLPRDELLVDCL